MLPARPADPQIPNSTRERTDCTSLLATLVVLVVVSPPSRLVSLHKSAKDADNRVRKSLLDSSYLWRYETLIGWLKSIMCLAQGFLCIRGFCENYIDYCSKTDFDSLSGLRGEIINAIFPTYSTSAHV